MKILKFKNQNEVIGEPLELTWEEFVTTLVPLKLKEGHDPPCYIPGEVKNNSRVFVLRRCMIVLDYHIKNFDNVFSIFRRKIMNNCKFYVHSTLLDNPSNNDRHVRLIIPLQYPINESEFTMVSDHLISKIGLHTEVLSKARNRLISYPVSKKNYEYYEGNGDLYFY